MSARARARGAGGAHRRRALQCEPTGASGRRPTDRAVSFPGIGHSACQFPANFQCISCQISANHGCGRFRGITGVWEPIERQYSRNSGLSSLRRSAESSTDSRVRIRCIWGILWALVSKWEPRVVWRPRKLTLKIGATWRWDYYRFKRRRASGHPLHIICT